MTIDQRVVTDLEHVDGVPWWQAPKPRRFHRCRAQTGAWYGFCIRVERCACGAIRRDYGRWFDRNSR